MRRIGNFIVRTIDYVFIGLLAIILLASVISFSEMFSSGVLKYAIVLLSLIAVLVFVLNGKTVLDRIRKWFMSINNLRVWQMCILIFAIVFITKTFFVFLFDNDLSKHMDMGLYKSFGTQIAQSGMITESTLAASRYKYQVIYGLFLSPVIKLFGTDSKVLLTFLSFLFALISVLLFDIIRKHVGKNKAFFGIVLFNLLPVGLFETQLLIHETALLFFYILSFWLLTKFLDSKYHLVLRFLILMLSAILIAFGNKINQGGTVVIISYCIYAVIMLCKDKITVKRFLETLVTIVCYVLCFFIVSNICVSYANSITIPSEEDSIRIQNAANNSVPYGWGLYLGMNPDKAGLWNNEDAATYQAFINIDDPDEARQYQNDLLDERKQYFIDNPLYIPVHLFKKIKNLWGSPLLPFAYELGNKNNEFVLHGAHGIIYKGIRFLSYWVFVLLCTLIVFSHKRHNHINLDVFYSPVSQFKMMIIGLTLVLFLFEVTPKYVSHMQIIMFSIGIFSVDGFMDNSRRFHNKMFVKRKGTV